MTYYFPPNPFKIGDCLLTVDILSTVGEKDDTICFTSPLIGSILSHYHLDKVTFQSVNSIQESFSLAHSISETSQTFDLQRLNCYHDYPEFRHLFNEETIPERCKHDWISEHAVKCWGLQSFSELFKEMVSLSSSPSEVPIFQKPIIEKANRVLVFPHAETDQQQLDCWEEIVHFMSKQWQVGVVASKKTFDSGPWDEYFDLTAKALVENIAKSSACIGGATGLSHLSSEMHIPTLVLWKYPDYPVFRPRNKEAQLVTEGLDDMNLIQSKINSFMSSIS